MSHDPVREFIRAFNERDLDAFAEVLDPEVEIHSMRGLRKGREAARLWATRPPGGVQQTIELEELYENGGAMGVAAAEGADMREAQAAADGAAPGESRRSAVALIRRVWRWEEDGSHASIDEMAWLFELRGGRVRSWRPFEDRAAALRAGGFR